MTCQFFAGICPKPGRTYGEPHYCGEVDWHTCSHRCRRCGMEFHADPGSTFMDQSSGTRPHLENDDGYGRAMPAPQSDGGSES